MASAMGILFVKIQKQESYMGCKTIEDMVDLFYPYFCGDIVKDKTLDKDVLREKLEAMKIIADNCGIVEKYDDKNNRRHNIWDMASEIKLAIEKEAAGFNDCMFAVAITDYIKGEFAAFENQFIPSLEKLTLRDRSDMAAVTTIEGDDGSEVMFEIKAFPEATAQRLAEICKTVSRPVKEDAKIREVLITSSIVRKMWT